MSVLKTCPYCGGHGYINQFEDVEGGYRAWANECIACKGTGTILVPETNADRIRRMSDEELAEWLCSLMTAECCDQRCPARDICNLGDNGLVKWMKQPAEED